MVSKTVVPCSASERIRLHTLLLAARVETSRGLVEKQQLGRNDDARSNIESMLHASGVPFHLALTGIAEPAGPEQLDGALSCADP